MVKFGRHVDFFVANELDSTRKLYVVPYKEIQHKTCIEIPKPPPPPPTVAAPPNNSAVITTNVASPSPSPLQQRSRDQTPELISQPAASQQQPTIKKSSASGLSALFDNPPPPPPHLPPSNINIKTTNDFLPPPSPMQIIKKPAGVSAAEVAADLSYSAQQQKGGTNNNAAQTQQQQSDNLNLINTSLPKKVNPHNAVTLTTGTGAELAAALRTHLVISQQVVKNSHIMIPSHDDFGLLNDDKGTRQQQQQRQQEEPQQTRLVTIGENTKPSDTITTSEEEREAQAHFFAQRFTMEWRICLKKASVDFDRAMQLFWSEVFQGISEHEDDDDDDNNEEEKDESQTNYAEAIRGAMPDAALQLYVSAVPPSRAQSTFSFMKDIHATALINAEALRKLVKKFDKMHYKLDRHSYLLSAKLLPEVYASNFSLSLASLYAGLNVFRMLLAIDDDEDNNSLATAETFDEEIDVDKAIRNENRRLRKLATMDDDLRDVAVLSGGYFANDKDTDDELVKRRMEELQWLRNMVEGIDSAYIPFLVAHRGFHSIHDRGDVRPLENSLMSYEAAWTNGIHLCECDIALTKDERIILAHDENFTRLGMDPTSPLCNRTVRDLTFKELMNCPLKTGARPPLLFDVLRSAMAIGGDAKMIVEIKAGNTEAGPALARMFVRHPQLMEHVAVVMSFDAFIMHNLRMEMAAVYEQLHISHQREHQFSAMTATAATTTTSPDYKPPARIPISHELEYDNVGPGENPAIHPLKAPILSNIALGSTLSSSPNLGPSFMGGHNRAPSHTRKLSKVGGLGNHNRLDSRDMFGLGMRIGGGTDEKSAAGDVGLGLTNLGMSLAEIDTSMSQSSTFLPIHKGEEEGKEVVAVEEEEKKEKDAPPLLPPANDPPVISFPKLLLITVAEAPKADYELFVDITKPEKVAELDGWLRGGDGGTLDGVYMQYQKAMHGPEGSKTMRNLASRYDVGMWGANPVPDDWNTFHTLVTECHVSYVNSSLPKHFRRKMKRSMSANTLQLNAIANKSSLAEGF